MSGRRKISQPDLLIRGGKIVAPEGVRRADLAIADGKIVAIEPEITEGAAETIEAAGLHVFPGILDAHVHFNEPGRADWEGLATGPAALAAGGGTAFFDMPLNSIPPVLDAASLGKKRMLAERKSRLDFALWGGLVPGNLDQLGELRDAGAIGLKAFMCASGVEEFPAVTDLGVLRKGMKLAAGLGMIVAVHAEDDALAAECARAQRSRGGIDRRSWLASRPVEVELRAIRNVIEIAGETGCSLHIVHVSSPEGLSLVSDAKRRGVDATAETCPHYLLLGEDDVLRLGAPAKCTPPLRSASRRDALWNQMKGSAVDTIGSDHSPAPPEMKSSADFFDVWGGISGCQHAFALLIDEARRREREDKALARLAALLAANVAKRFRISSSKGRLAVGLDADIALLDLRADRILRNDQLLYRHPQGPYDGRSCGVAVVLTLVRGDPVYADGRVASGALRGQFLRPTLP